MNGKGKVEPGNSGSREKKNFSFAPFFPSSHALSVFARPNSPYHVNVWTKATY